ncbi:uncharacterized protein LOC131431894 [Malaya genurostris]|uniref:uncharacterized protein LOC131431894 n=1 Tax=Malaya genurostris TaxID=325434 RepID=UPI0026F3A69D|nr:uncharacterized protein LOC131431894 [Malaya genurostris]
MEPMSVRPSKREYDTPAKDQLNDQLTFNPNRNRQNNLQTHEDSFDGSMDCRLHPSTFTLRYVREFRSPDGEEYIRKDYSTGQANELGFSACVSIESMKITFINEGCQMLVDDDLKAEIMIAKPELLDQTRNFEQAKKVLLDRLRVEKVLSDGLLVSRNQLRTEFRGTLKNIVSKANCQLVTDCINLKKILQKYSQIDYQIVCKTVIDKQICSVELREIATKLYDAECGVKKRTELLPPIIITPETDFSELNTALKWLDCTLQHVGEFRSSDGKEYIRKNQISRKPNELGFSACLSSESGKITIINEGCQMSMDDDLKAEIMIEKPELLDETRSFEQAKKALLDQIRFEKVLLDRVLEK